MLPAYSILIREGGRTEKVLSNLFLTNTDGRYPAKTAMGMYDLMHIENDVSKIIEVYDKFYASTNTVMNAAIAA